MRSILLNKFSPFLNWIAVRIPGVIENLRKTQPEILAMAIAAFANLSIVEWFRDFRCI
jgi:hypothetical protein